MCAQHSAAASLFSVTKERQPLLISMINNIQLGSSLYRQIFSGVEVLIPRCDDQ